MAMSEGEKTEMVDRIKDLEASMKNYVAYAEAQKQDFDTKVKEEVLNVKSHIDDLYKKSMEEHEINEGKMQDLYIRTNKSFLDMKTEFDKITIKMGEWEAWSGPRAGGERAEKEHYYIPTKNLLPDTFKGELNKWKQWKEDVEDYMDTVNKGMKIFLAEVIKEKGMLDDTFTDQHVQKYGPKVTGDRVQVWRALKKLTGDEARRVISSVKNEDGFRAWRQLVENF